MMLLTTTGLSTTQLRRTFGNLVIGPQAILAQLVIVDNLKSFFDTFINESETSVEMIRLLA